MQIKVNVSVKDIDDGVRHSSTFCPVALAINRAVPGICAKILGTEMVLAHGRSQNRWYLTPSAALDFVQAYDEGEPVEPFTFTLEI